MYSPFSLLHNCAGIPHRSVTIIPTKMRVKTYMTPLPKEQIRILPLAQIVRAFRQSAHFCARGTPHALRVWCKKQVLELARGLGEVHEVGEVE